jgi:hypothetical protein
LGGFADFAQILQYTLLFNIFTTDADNIIKFLKKTVPLSIILTRKN